MNLNAGLTVIITTRNRAPLLAHALRGLLQGSSHPEEILVVDNASTDDTRDMLGLLRDRSAAPIQVIEEREVGYAAARNAGLSRAGHELVAFLDDDCVPDRRWVETIRRAHAEAPAALAIGGRTLGHGSSVVEQAGHLFGTYATLKGMLDLEGWLSVLRDLEQVLDRAHFVAALSTQNLSLKWSRLDGQRFDPRAGLNEDLDYCWRIYQREPGGLRYRPDMVCFHQYRRTAAAFLAQHFLYGASYHDAKRLFLRKGTMPPHLRDGRYPRTLLDYLAFALHQSLGAPLPIRARGQLLSLLLSREAAFVAGYATSALRAVRVANPDGGER